MGILSNAKGAMSALFTRQRQASAPAGNITPLSQATLAEDISRRDRMERKIEEFDEDADAPIVKLVVTFFLFLFSIGTVILATLVGLSFGEAFAGPFKLDAEVMGIYCASVFIELAFAGLALAIARAIGRSKAERMMLLLLLLALILFIVIGAGSAVAQFVLLSSLQTHRSSAWQTAIVFRSIVPSLFDVAAAVFLAIYTRKNLEKFLREQTKKEEAIEQMSKSDIRIEEAYSEAENRRAQKEEEMASRRRREEVLNRIESKIGEAAVTVVESTVERLALPADTKANSNFRRIQ